MDCSVASLTACLREVTYAPLDKNGRRVFVVRSFRPTVAQEDVLGRIIAIQRRFQDEFFPTLNDVFHQLHQRSAQNDKKGQVRTTHLALNETVLIVANDVSKATEEAFDLSEHIHLIQNRKDQCTALSSFLQIEYVSKYLTSLANDLSSILKSTYHHEALEYYKTQVKACDAIASITEFDKQLIELEKLSERALKHPLPCYGQEPLIAVRECEKLYHEVFEYMYYVATFLTTKYPDGHYRKVLEHRLEIVKSNLKPRIHTQPYADQPFPDISREATLYLSDRATEQVALPKPNYFRNYQHGVSWTYKVIYDQYMALQNVAKALYRAQSELLFGPDSFVPQGLLPVIQRERISLTKVALTTKVHAGWYYAGGLQAQLEHIETISKDKRPRYLHAVTQLSRQPTTLNALFECVKATVQINDGEQHARVYGPIDQTLAQVGASLLKLSGEEEQTPKVVFARETVWTRLPSFIINYLLKGFLRNLHFSLQEADPEFEAVLHLVENDPAFCKGFRQCLQESPLFAELYNAYKSDIGVLEVMSNFMCLLHDHPPIQAKRMLKLADAYVRYHKLARMLETFDPSEEARLLWLKERLDTFYQQNKAAFSHNVPFITELTNSAFSNSAVEHMFTIPELDESLTGISKILFQRCLLDRLINDPDNLTTKHLDYLATLFLEYVTDADIRALWRNQYDVGFMEIALQRFIQKTKNFQMLQSRGNGYDRWSTVVSLVSEFRKTNDQDERMRLYEQAKAHVTKTYTLADLYNPSTFENIAGLLLTEMLEFTQGSRRFYCK